MSDSNLLIEPLPPGWKNHQFGDVCDRVKDSYQPVDDGDTPYVGLEHLAQGFPAFVGRGQESEVRSSKTAFKAGDILFGKLRPYLRKGAQADFDGVCSTDILAFRAKAACESEFLKFIIHSDEFVAHEKSTTSGVQHPRTSWPSLREFRLSLPPLPEQKKIAHILSTVQQCDRSAGADHSDHHRAEKGPHAQTLHRRPARRTPEANRDRPGPRELGGGALRQVRDAYSVATIFGNRISEKVQVPVIGATRVIGYHDTANVKAPGVTVVRSGSSAGKPLFIAEDFWAHNVLLYVKDFQGNVPKFVYYKILALDLTQYRHGVAVPTLNRNTFSAIELTLPSPEEQQEIADTLDAVRKRTEVAERKKSQLQDIFRTLLHELMTAKTRVHDLDLPTGGRAA
jgi:type I restriction enzyme S subunit